MHGGRAGVLVSRDSSAGRAPDRRSDIKEALGANLATDERSNPDTRNRTRDHLIAAYVYSQMLCQLSYVRRYFSFGIALCVPSTSPNRESALDIHPARIELATFSVLG